MMPQDDPAMTFVTDDMCLVSVLKYMGHTPQGVEWTSGGGSKGKCYWVFMRTNNLATVVGDFLDRRLQVEPKQFNFLFGETKQEFYKQYDANRGR
jgi:hypothetical protein